MANRRPPPSFHLYPAHSAERDRWILSLRPERNPVDAWRPHAFFLEQEPSATGELVSTATIFLVNRECPWRCLMCDLWRNTLTESVPPGAIPAQVDFALRQLGPARQIKLYNSGSFFDPRAVPVEDYAAIAERAQSFERMIVECHPALIGPSCLAFKKLLRGQLEVAMGLETAHPEILPRLNKRLSLQQFAKAARFLAANGIALRVFVLVQPPFLGEAEALTWANRSVDFAFDCGAAAVSLIPTRPGNGALDELARQGQFAPPKLGALEAALAYGIGTGRGRVLADLWDLEKFSQCPQCFERRRARLERMNLEQMILAEVNCAACDGF